MDQKTTIDLLSGVMVKVLIKSSRFQPLYFVLQTRQFKGEMSIERARFAYVLIQIVIHVFIMWRLKS